ncbi:MAG: hypothetical protein LUH55_00770, partial [Bacteroides thetaiotaomicron]|nr:hypothetical protein [Bacteroides thetaiotaomicron]
KIKQAFLDMPAADVEPVRHGRWEIKSEFRRCTECGYPISLWYPTKFCSNCGAKMDGGSEE